MDNASFDRLTASLAAGSSRRGVLGALAAVVGVGVVGPTARAAKGGNGKGKGKDKGNGNGNAHGKHKIGICHKGRYKLIPSPAWKGHRKHGDALCQPLEQVGNVCRTYSQECGAVDGGCTYTVNSGGCTDINGATSTCDDAGNCIVAVAPPSEG